MPVEPAHHKSKAKLLDAAVQVIRGKGYSATTVDDVCRAAGLTKGSFFHHFDSKQELALEAAAHFSGMADELFAHAPYRALSDPVDRLLGYVDFRQAILRGKLPDFTCLLGTMVQEAYDTHPPIRVACEAAISHHAASLESDVAQAMEQRGIAAGWTAASLALYMQAVIQGAFVLAKAKHGREVASDCLDHLRRYLQLLFNRPGGVNILMPPSQPIAPEARSPHSARP